MHHFLQFVLKSAVSNWTILNMSERFLNQQALTVTGPVHEIWWWKMVKRHVPLIRFNISKMMLTSRSPNSFRHYNISEMMLTSRSPDRVFSVFQWRQQAGKRWRVWSTFVTSSRSEKLFRKLSTSLEVWRFLQCVCRYSFFFNTGLRKSL